MAALLAAAVALSAAPVVRADTVVLKDRSRLEGSVMDMDATELRLKSRDGQVIVVARSRISRILFGPSEAVLRVEVRCPAGDDEFDLLLNGEPVIEKIALTGSDWVDVSGRLHDGNNELRPVVRNQRHTWAYRWELRINGKVSVFACGLTGIKGKGCTCCGLRGNETGTIDGIDPVWLHIDRELGTAEILGR